MDRHYTMLVGILASVTLLGFTGIMIGEATTINQGMNNPYALPDDHPTIDRERPTLTWCPDGPWTITEPTTLYLSMHDNSRFNFITYTIDGNEYDLLGSTTSTVQFEHLGYYEGSLYVEDVHGNYEDRYGYAINFTTPTTLKIVMYYQEDQASTYDCAGITSNSWFFQTAYASGELTQFHEITMVAGNATEQLSLAQIELEKLKTELAIIEAELKLAESQTDDTPYNQTDIDNAVAGVTSQHEQELAALVEKHNQELADALATDSTPFDQDDIDHIVNSITRDHDAEIDDLKQQHLNETTKVMTAVNQTLDLVTEVREDVLRVINLCR